MQVSYANLWADVGMSLALHLDVDSEIKETGLALNLGIDSENNVEMGLAVNLGEDTDLKIIYGSNNPRIATQYQLAIGTGASWDC